MEEFLRFKAIKARQSARHSVVSFAATAEEVFQIARIDRAGRSETGDLFGFQRPQVAKHIHEIRDYLKTPDAVLPNSVVLAFVQGVQVVGDEDGVVEVCINVTAGPIGLIVDGQQRLSALHPLKDRDFQVFVSAILCDSEEELRRQFILINNTRPLPKELIYELLPTVSGLPSRLSSRAFAAHISTKLNYWYAKDGQPVALAGEIKQHTNPRGTISSNAIQKVIMNSRSNGALRDFALLDDAEEKSIQLIADFYGAVVDVFPEAWLGLGPRNSRLKHSVGIIAMGYALETAYGVLGARTRDDFRQALQCLVDEDICAWTSGYWFFGDQDWRRWDQLQNTPPDIRLLSEFLVRVVRDQGIRKGGPLDRELYSSRRPPEPIAEGSVR